MLKICDSTLRDGEQQACINFTQAQKLEIADALQRLGVDSLDMMPCANEIEQETVRMLVQQGLSVFNLTPLRKELIDLSLSISPRIILFQAMSDELLKIRYKSDCLSLVRQQNLEQFIEHIDYVKMCCPDAEIFISGEDGINADEGYLLELIREIESFCTNYSVSDSKGTATPEQIRRQVELIRKHSDISIRVHTHNDLGNADENAAVAIRAGATILSGTITGIGERAGNCDLRKVLETLKADGIIFPNINYDLFAEVETVVRNHAGRGRSAPRSPESFWHESGIHVDALLADPAKGYSAIDPQTLGLEHKIFFSKKSGIANWKYFLGDRLNKRKLILCREIIKEASLQGNRSYTFDEATDVVVRQRPDIFQRIMEIDSTKQKV